MPFLRPTLSEMIQQAQTDVASQLGVLSLLRYSPESAFAFSFAGLAHGLYGYLDWIAQQAVPFTATDEYLEAWASLAAVTRKPATAAAGRATWPGTNGAPLPTDTVAVAADGRRYTITAGAAVSGGAAVVDIQAETPGAAGNIEVGAALTLASAVTGVLATGSVTTAAVGGADLETDAALRTRMLQAYAATPQGGAAADYVTWALAVPGVTRAWAAPNAAGAGTVVVYVMLDDVRSGSGGFPSGTNGTAAAEERGTGPATGDQLLVADAIYPLRPATALVYVAAPTALPINVTINDLNDSSLRPAVLTAIADMLLERASTGGTIYPSEISAAIDAVPGVTRFTLAAPSAPVTAAANELHVVGTPTWG